MTTATMSHTEVGTSQVSRPVELVAPLAPRSRYAAHLDCMSAQRRAGQSKDQHRKAAARTARMRQSQLGRAHSRPLTLPTSRSYSLLNAALLRSACGTSGMQPPHRSTTRATIERCCTTRPGENTQHARKRTLPAIATRERAKPTFLPLSVVWISMNSPHAGRADHFCVTAMIMLSSVGVHLDSRSQYGLSRSTPVYQVMVVLRARSGGVSPRGFDTVGGADVMLESSQQRGALHDEIRPELLKCVATLALFALVGSGLAASAFALALAFGLVSVCLPRRGARSFLLVRLRLALEQVGEV